MFGLRNIFNYPVWIVKDILGVPEFQTMFLKV
jgi:hypothetical protein